MFRWVPAVLLGLTLLDGCGGSQSSAADPAGDANDPCYDADIAAKRVWNEQTKVEVKARVLEWGGELGGQVAEQKALEVTSSMDRLTDDWARMRKAVCKDHFTRQTLTKEAYQKRADCLDRLLTRQRTFLTSLTSPRTDVSEQLTAINSELDGCR